MNGFTPAEIAACQRLVHLAVEEDLGASIDLTSHAFISTTTRSEAIFAARSSGSLAGLPAAELVVAAVDARLTFEPLAKDGAVVEPGTQLARIKGPLRSILAAERIALNFLQHLAGVATLTRQFVEAVAGLPCRILDTRKTLPGWRLLDKYAVRCAGGQNHRMGLFDGILIKDNHLASLGGGPEAVTHAVKAARAFLDPQPLQPPPFVEVEVEGLSQVDAALAARPDIILLDNMTLDHMLEAVRRRNGAAPGVLLEASGGVTLKTVRAIAETGVDRISVGALTHSAPALDIALDYVDD
jgi:nicotinate-nucleotide pyrophosphorylase (carboxylating)